MDKEARRKELLEEAKKLAKKIAEEYKPEKIILFGSAVSDEVRGTSDIDLLVVKETDERPVKRDQEVLRLLNPIRSQIPLDLLVYTPEEIDWRAKGGEPLILDALESGRILYEQKY